MHSLRAAFAEAGISTPPFTLRILARHKGISPPITMRKVLGLPPADFFPENEIELFKSYDLNPGKENSDFISEIVEAIKATKFDRFQLPSNFPENTEARRLQRDRRRLIEMLELLAAPSSEVADDTKLIRNHILTRQAEKAEELFLNDKLPKKIIQFPSGPNQPIWKNALRKDDVEGISIIGAVVKILRYNGPEVPIEKLTDVRNFLHPRTVERRFREGLLRAESLAGQRRFGGKKHDENVAEGAIEEYEKLFGIQDLSNAQLKFVALRQATAQNALADQRFNALPPGDESEREKVKEIYRETAEILKRRGVNPVNPLAQDLLIQAENQLILVESGFNALGSSTVMSAGYQKDPISDELLISKKAVDFLVDAEIGLSRAVSALDSFRRFTDKLEGELDEQIQLDLNTDDAKGTLQDITKEIDTLELERKKLDKSESFLDIMIPLQGAATIGFTILAAAGKDGGGGRFPGPGSSAVNGAFQTLELFHQKDLLKVDRRILDLNQEAFEARRRHAQRRLNTVDNLAVGNQVQIQNILELTNSFEDFTFEAMRSVMRKAFKAEVQLAFELGTALDSANMIINPGEILNVENDRNINRMINKFSVGERSQLERLRKVINKLIAGGVEDKQFSLEELDMRAFLRFKQTGVTDFYISLYNLDQFFPGRTNIRITDVHIDLDNLNIPIDGITVTLTHRGNFLVRDPKTVRNTTKLIPEESIVNHAEIEMRKGRNVTIDGVTFISAAESSRSFIVGGEPSPFPPPSIPPNFRRGLEGYGIAGLWNIEINQNELDEINLANLKDVFLTFEFSFVEGDGQARANINRLIQKFEAEQDHTRDVITFFSMRDNLNLEINEKLEELINETPHKVDIEINEQTGTLEGQYEQTLLKGIVLQVVNKDGGVAGVEVLVRRDDVNRDFQFTTVAEGFTADLTDESNILIGDPRFPVGGTWTIEVPDTNALRDRGDIRWFLLHDEKPPMPPET